MNHLNAVLLGALSLLTVSSQAFAADSPEPKPAPAVLSEEEFQKQRTFMLEDLALRIKVFQTAHACAEKAETSVAFAACNQELRDSMLAHINKKPSADGQE